MCKLSAELLGIMRMVKNLGRELRGTALADSTAALAIADRKGEWETETHQYGIVLDTRRRGQRKTNL